MLGNVARVLIVVGAIVVVLGVVLWLTDKAGWLDRFPFGKLPGDIRVERDNFRFYFPLTTCLLLSAIATLILWLITRTR